MAGFVGLLLACGCASIVKELKAPPFPYAATHHTRVVGIQASYSGYGLRFGFCSDVITLIPCATNGISAPAFSDRFKVGQSGFDTTISEEINTGWKDQPPPPMMRLFSPKAQDQPRSSSNHGDAFVRKQASATPDRPRSAIVGALDSTAPVFALQFNDKERRPVAVLELNADSAINTYSVIGVISYTNYPPSPPK